MDPVSVIGLVGTAVSIAQVLWDTGDSLLRFVQQAKRIDKSAQRFAQEIKSLGGACEAVGSRLGPVVKDLEERLNDDSHSTSRPTHLWNCLNDELVACQETALQLQEAVRVTEKCEPGQSFFRKAIEQIGLNSKGAEIVEARNRINSHTATLQTLLITISIMVSYLGPKRADQQLLTELSKLRIQLGELRSLRSRRNLGQTVSESNEVAIIAAGERVISSGETLYESSIGGGSMVGEFTSDKLASVHNWLNLVNIIDHRAERSTPAETRSVSSLSFPEDTRHVESAPSDSGPTRQAATSVFPVDTTNPGDQGGNDDYHEEFMLEATTSTIPMQGEHHLRMANMQKQEVT